MSASFFFCSKYVTAQKESIRSQLQYIIMQGTLANPINLDLDQPEQEKDDIEQQLEQARKKQLLEEAKLSRNGIELALAVIKTTIKGELKIKNQTLNRAIIKYFRNRIGMNVSCEHFHPRKEPDYENNPINPLQFLLYGVDFLSTAMIQDRFKLIDTTIQQIMWINSSCCKLIFKTESQAKMVLESQVIDKKTLEFKLDEESDGRLQGWIGLRPYHFLNFQRQLIIRYATQNQKDIPKEEMNKYKQYEEAYAELLPTLFEEFNAVQAFEEVMKEIDREKFEDKQNRHQYQNRNRRMRNFNNRQPSRQRMERSRTRDKKYQNYNKQGKNSENFYDKHRNTSFEFRGRASNRHQNSNEINTSYQMAGQTESHRLRGDRNIPNTSFQMQSNRNFQNRQNNRNRGGWQRNNNTANSTANANEFQAKLVHQVVYQHRPVDQKQMNTHNNNNSQVYMNPPRKQNVYFDCNGIDDEENLSYEFRSNLDDDNQDSDHLQEIAMNFNQMPQNKHNKSRYSNKQDLSFLVNSFNNSKEDYVHKLDDSFRFSKQTHQNILNKSLNDSSFMMNPPKASDKATEEKEKQKLDFNQLFLLHGQDEISPIHNTKNDTSFVMKDPQNEDRNYANKRNDDSYLDFKKPSKNKKKDRFIEDDDGY